MISPKKGFSNFIIIFILLLMGVLAGCAASRSQMSGSFDRPTEKNVGAKDTSILFLFRHMEQKHGFDAIPKLKSQGVKDFDNLFRDAFNEFSNVSNYVTFTESPTDVNNPARRQELKKLRHSNDYTIEVDFLEESSFKKEFLSGTISVLSLTIIPIPYSWDYTTTSKLYNKEGKLLRSYQRKATLDNWVEVFLIFAYPFYPLEGKREQIYAESLHDIFRQIETETVLK
jgi:hypothetical protein